MAEILITPLGNEDLQQIWDYLAKEAGNEIATKFLNDFSDKCSMLAQFPDAGHLRNEYLLNLRSFSFKKYIIFFLKISNGIEILRVLHSSRDIPQVFDEMIPLEP